MRSTVSPFAMKRIRILVSIAYLLVICHCWIYYCCVYLSFIFFLLWFSVLACKPHLNDTKDLIRELNRTNGLFKFVRIMREKFQEVTSLGRVFTLRPIYLGSFWESFSSIFHRSNQTWMVCYVLVSSWANHEHVVKFDEGFYLCLFQKQFSIHIRNCIVLDTGRNFPQSPTLHQESAAVSMSAPVTSVSTDTSDSSLKENEYPHEVNRQSKKVNLGRGTKPSILSPASVRRSPRFVKVLSFWFHENLHSFLKKHVFLQNALGTVLKEKQRTKLPKMSISFLQLNYIKLSTTPWIENLVCVKDRLNIESYKLKKIVDRIVIMWKSAFYLHAELFANTTLNFNLLKSPRKSIGAVNKRYGCYMFLQYPYQLLHIWRRPHFSLLFMLRKAIQQIIQVFIIYL